MGKAAKFVASAALLVIGGMTEQPWLVQVGWSMFFKGAAEAMEPRQRLAGSDGIQQEYSGTVEPRVAIYGQMRVGGCSAIPPPWI